jgi:hypothetical protein
MNFSTTSLIAVVASWKHDFDLLHDISNNNLLVATDEDGTRVGMRRRRRTR